MSSRQKLGILFASVVFFAAGCQSLWSSVKSSAAPAGGAAGGAAIGTLAPPFGPIIGAAVGAVITHALAENASLRSGEIIGEGSLDRQIERWAIDYGKERVARVAAKEGENWLRTIILWGSVGLLVAFLVRNRHNFRDLGLWYGLKHSIFGGDIGKAIGR